MLEFLIEMVHRLHTKSFEFSGEHRIEVIKVQEALQTLHHHLKLVGLGSKIFTRAHEAVSVQLYNTALKIIQADLDSLVV